MKILEIIQENPTISVKQISEIIDEIKYDAVRWNIAELKKKIRQRRISHYDEFFCD